MLSNRKLPKSLFLQKPQCYFKSIFIEVIQFSYHYFTEWIEKAKKKKEKEKKILAWILSDNIK